MRIRVADKEIGHQIWHLCTLIDFMIYRLFAIAYGKRCNEIGTGLYCAINLNESLHFLPC